MDIGAILNNFWGQLIAALSAGAIALLITKFKDLLMFKLFSVLGPKYKAQIGAIIKAKINQLLNKITELDDKYLDPFKKQYPQTGTAIENEVAEVLEEGAKVLIKAAKIVRDE